MARTKVWTVNCGILKDDEFDSFVKDLEDYIIDESKECTLPQSNSEAWLQKFICDYSNWPHRKFISEKHSLQSYFRIDTRLL